MRSLREHGEPRPLRAAGQPSRPRHPARLPIVLRGIAIACLAASCALVFKFGIPLAEAARAADALAIKAGLGINQIAISGSRNTLSDDIFAALRLEQAGSLLTYDPASARNRLEALPWVETAEVTRTLPDGLDVNIRERRPFAVWQHLQLMFLIDAEGRTLEPTARVDHKDLPLVVGEDADSGAVQLLAVLAKHPGIRDRLLAAVRVGGRRWDLQLKDAPTLMLPEDGMADTLVWVERMDREERLLERRLAAIDLRVSGRVAFRLAPELPVAGGKLGARPSGQAPDAKNRGA